MELNSEESDSDFIPEEKPPQEELKPKVQSERTQKLWEEMKAEKPQKTPKKESLDEAMQAAMKVKAKMNPNKNLNVNYAGESSSAPLKRTRPSLDKLLSEVTKKKPLNSLAKSQVDWENYKDKLGIEDTLSKNRKSGFIQKQEFLQTTKEREKDHISNLKRKKPNQ
uniref:BCNT-C domain-containing protein n=1 Tax=Fabrea salina TaxID=342563 RepID=A0A7S3IB42_9CILI|mmetsp:Transcript_1486/g.2386  ORF Transcript_1486/g.2386 Transcript_1486/m.2386 type:complete len:166 (+) Transcript_1486:321-818(+)